MRPLKVEDVHIQVLVPVTPSPSPLSSSSSSSGYVLPTPTVPQQPKLPALHLDDIRIQIHMCPAETLFHLSRSLSPSEQASVSSWLSRSASLTFLRRLSSHLSNALSIASPASIVSQLEARARLVAEAMGVRAVLAADANENTSSREIELRRATKLLAERSSIATAIDQFDEKIATFSNTDAETAALLVPARKSLRTRLRAVTAELAAYGFPPPDISVEECQQKDEPLQQSLFVPEPPSDPLLFESESDTDESDLARAVRLPPEEQEFVLPEPRSESGGYMSGETDDEAPQACHDSRGSTAHRDISVATVCKADFVIDLDGSSVYSQKKIEIRLPSDTTAPPQGVCEFGSTGQRGGLQELEQLGIASPIASRKTSGLKSMNKKSSRSSDEQGDGSDLERNARKNRNRGREKSHTRTRDKGTAERDTNVEDDFVMF